MAVNGKNVRIGTPDQLTTGAVLVAPEGTAIPTLADLTPQGVKLDRAFKDGGYVSSDGITLTPELSTTDITDWSGNLIRRAPELFNGTITWKMIETANETFEMAVGSQFVEARSADATHGNQVAASFGARLSPVRSWVFKMKDGDARMLIVVPRGQVTAMEEIVFNATEPVGWSLTLSTYPDAQGNNIYILTDDGAVTSAGAGA